MALTLYCLAKTCIPTDRPDQPPTAAGSPLDGIVRLDFLYRTPLVIEYPEITAFQQWILTRLGNKNITRTIFAVVRKVLP